MRAAIFYIELPDSRMAVLNYFDWQMDSAYWNDAISLGWQQYSARRDRPDRRRAAV